MSHITGLTDWDKVHQEVGRDVVYPQGASAQKTIAELRDSARRFTELAEALEIAARQKAHQ